MGSKGSHLTGSHELERLVDLLELVGRARAVALLLRQLDPGIGQVVVQPGAVDTLALALHGARIIRR
jgi:hypothetical protein